MIVRCESEDRPTGHIPFGLRGGHGLQRLRPVGAEGKAGTLPPGVPRLGRDARAQGDWRRMPSGSPDRRDSGAGTSGFSKLHPRGVRPGFAHGRQEQAPGKRIRTREARPGLTVRFLLRFYRRTGDPVTIISIP